MRTRASAVYHASCAALHHDACPGGPEQGNVSWVKLPCMRCNRASWTWPAALPFLPEGANCSHRRSKPEYAAERGGILGFAGQMAAHGCVSRVSPRPWWSMATRFLKSLPATITHSGCMILVTALFHPLPMVDQLKRIHTPLEIPEDSAKSNSCLNMQSRVGVGSSQNNVGFCLLL